MVKSANSHTTPAQRAFQELFVGTLIYAVVLGFFNDYTHIVEARSFSTIFFASVVLEILTYYVFQIKKWILIKLKHKQQIRYKIIKFFAIWLIMFVSKFVFVWTIDLVFGEYITINGFFGILLVVATVTILHKGAGYMYVVLGKEKSKTQHKQ